MIRPDYYQQFVAFKRIDAALSEEEYRTDFVWAAVERELKRRERCKEPKPAAK